MQQYVIFNVLKEYCIPKEEEEEEIKREQKTIQKWCLVPPVNRDEFLVKSKPKKIIKPRRL